MARIFPERPVTPHAPRLRTWLPHAALIAAFMLWGFNNVPMKIGGAEWNPVAFNGFRFAGIAPFLWVYTYWYFRSRGLPWSFAWKDLLPLAGFAFISSVGLEVSLSYAIQYSTSANAAILGRGMMPIWTGLFALAMKDMQLTPRLLVGIPLAFAGSLVIVSGNGLGFGPDTWRGDILLLIRSVIGAVYLIGMRRLLQKYPVPLLLAIEFTISGAILLPFAFATTTAEQLASISAAGWWSLVFAAFVALFLGYMLHNWGLGRLGSFKASVYGYLMPISAALSGYLVLGEAITAAQGIGAAAILAAMYLVQRNRAPAAKSDSGGTV